MTVSVSTSNYLHKRRPSVVPSDAIFLSDKGKDFWVSCEESSNSELYLCSFYAPRSGTLLSAMKYTLVNGPFPRTKVTIFRANYEQIETDQGTMVVFHPYEF